MKNLFLCSALLLLGAQAAHAAVNFQGSDSMAGVIIDAINQAGMNDEIVYVGGGSGKGEAAMVNGDQGIAPMSRALNDQNAAVIAAQANGVQFQGNVIGLDGVGVFVNAKNSVVGLDIPTIKAIFTCAATQWEQIPGSNLTGAINAFRRNDASGTTDTFKNLVGISKFGACVAVLETTEDIAEKTAKDASAIGYSGRSALRETNRTVSVAKEAGAEFVELNVNTVRSFAYPLSRKLFVYEVKGARAPSQTEQKLLQTLLDRSTMDPILQDHEFYTID